VRYLSVCSGIEAATVAWHDLGWKPEAFSEIEKFPSQVLNHHYPDVPNLGDMTKYKEWNLNESIDILVGGTPCQSFSIAGLRQGLQDPRGNLMLTYLGILDKFRPKWCVWENVPGVLSSNGGRDFGSFLGALGELGYGFAYRVLDAQNFGVAQRRRRVFVVGCLGGWRSAAEVLFEPESLCRDSKKGRETREETSKFLTTGIGSRLDGETDQFVVKTYQGNQETTIAATLQTTCHEYSRADGFNTVVYENHPADSTVAARWGTGGGNVPFALAENTIGRQPQNGGNGDGFTEGGPMYTLNATGVHGVAQPIGFDAYNNDVTGDISKTIDTGQDYHHVPNVLQSMAVRRLTPVECERLQGFPDGYTDIKEKCPDGPRYKALGNSMAVPVMAWIGKRIQEVECGS
jgi:DNA (cytosine-5)-methyltransferase 1